MSIRAMSWAWDQSVDPGKKLILLCLADHADAEGKCWPGTKFVAEKTGFHYSTIRRQIRSLVQSKFIKKEPRFQLDNGGRQTSSIIELNIPPLVHSEPPPPFSIVPPPLVLQIPRPPVPS